MTVSNFQDQKPVKKEAGITYDFTLLNWLFKDAEVTKRAKDMKKVRVNHSGYHYSVIFSGSKSQINL